jgi:hypothetical protein
LIDFLNFEFEAEIGEYTKEALNDFIIQHQKKCMELCNIYPSWRIDKVIVNDKEKLMEVIKK